MAGARLRALIGLGVAISLAALVTMVVAPLIASRESEERRDRLSDEVLPLQTSLEQLQIDLALLAADARLSPSAGPNFDERFAMDRDGATARLARAVTAAEQAGFGDRTPELSAAVQEWLINVDFAVGLASTGDATAINAYLAEIVIPQLADVNGVIEALEDDVVAEQDVLREEVDDIDRLSRMILVGAGALAAISAGVLLALAYNNLRLLRITQRERVRFNAMVDSVRYGMYEIDSSGIIVYANPAAAMILGFRGAEEMLGKRAHGLFHHTRPDGSPYPFADCPIIQALTERRPCHVMEVFNCRDDRMLPVELTAAPIVMGGSVAGAAVVFQDVGARLRRDIVREDVLGFASHELRSPLAVISGFAAWLERRVDDMSEEEAEAVKAIASASNRLSGTVELFLDLARIDSGGIELDPEVTDFGELVRHEVDALRLLRPDAEVSVEMPTDPVLAWIDPNRVGQVVTNLLDNAVKYGGTPPQVTVRVSVTENRAMLSVVDNGSGVAAEDEPFLFDRFFRGRPTGQSAQSAKGLGVGLFISKEIVESSNGELCYSSPDEGGAEFRLLVPLADPDGPTSAEE